MGIGGYEELWQWFFYGWMQQSGVYSVLRGSQKTSDRCRTEVYGCCRCFDFAVLLRRGGGGFPAELSGTNLHLRDQVKSPSVILAHILHARSLLSSIFGMTKMFFDGDLQAGITQAVRDSQPVACFVLGNGGMSAFQTLRS